MKKEDLQAALEAISKSGIQVAGDLVLEKNVEYEVANVEEGGIGIQIVNGSTPKVVNSKKGSGKKDSDEKPPKPRELMTLKRRSKVLDGHLTLFFQKLTKEGWIDGFEANFKNLFSGQRDKNCQLTWTGLYGKGTLVELFKQLIKAELIDVPAGFTLSSILEGHFMDKQGQWLTGLDNGDPAHNKALPVIQECINLLKISPDADRDDLDDDFRSEYDQFDQQDMHWHKRK